MRAFTPQSPRIAVIGLTMALYEDAIPEYVAIYREQLARFSRELKPIAEFQEPVLCATADDLTAQLQRAETAGADAVLLIPLSYTPSLPVVKPLISTSLPIVIWNTQEAPSIEEDYSFDDLLRNHVPQGTQDITSVLLRRGRRFGLVSGHWQDRAAIAELGRWLRAAATGHAIHSLRAGRLGTRFPGMGDFDLADETLTQRWGPPVTQLQVDDLVERWQEVTDEDARAIVDQDRETYEVAAGVDAAMHLTSARLELALRKLVTDHQLDAFTMNFQELIDDGRLPTLPFLGLNKLLGEGLGYGAEGDLLAAVLMAQLRHLCGPATFTEIYTIDYARERLMMSHMQECNPALARQDEPIRLVPKPFWAPGVEPYVGMHFTLQPGPVTLVAVTITQDDHLAYIAHQAEIADHPAFPAFDIPHWLVQLARPAGEFLTAYSLAGGPHHLCGVPGHHLDALRRLARLQGFPLREI